MKTRARVLNDLLVSLLLDIPLLSVLALGLLAFGATFPPFSLFDVVSKILPGQLVIGMIELMVKVIRGLNLGSTDTAAKTAERIMAISLFAVVAVILSLIYLAIARRRSSAQRETIVSGVIFGVIVAIPVLLLATQDQTTTSFVVNGVWLVVVFVVWGLAHGFVTARLNRLTAVSTMPTETPLTESAHEITLMEAGLSRRQFLAEVGGVSALITLIGIGMDITLTGRTSGGSAAAALPLGTPDVGAGGSAAAAIDSSAMTDASGIIAAFGTRPEITPLGAYYRIDINAGSGPQIDEASYKLAISGLVSNPVQISLSDLRSQFTPMDQIITMACISNPVGGDLTSTIKWTGLSMQDLLKVVKPTADATHIRISGADGFFETVALDVIQKDPHVMLSYAWEDKPLTQEHGFPLRIYVPNLYGMKQPKWITKMEFTNQWQAGYWVVRGWDKDAIVRATAVVDTVAADHPIMKNGVKMIPVGGIAWAGARGISKVEVKVDEGAWTAAELRKPLSDKSWVIWRYDWPFQGGSHKFAVRCVETDGTEQIETIADTYPSGATGINAMSVNL
jgi:DMSO/TMAO reductase YedYZ molybdopterin-dependent catalytic subunit